MPIRLNKDFKPSDLKNVKATINCRIPSQAEIIEYATKMQNAGKNKKRRHNLLLYFGLKVMNKLEEGNIEIEKEGQFIPLSSNIDSPYYDSNWRQHIKKYAPKLIKAIAIEQYEGS